MATPRKHSKKASTQKAVGKNGKHRQKTGIAGGMKHFFVESKIAGDMHYKPPKWTAEWEKMKVGDLLQRIQGDLDELAARAYPTATPYYHIVKHRLLPKETAQAANALAFVTQRGATYLENLSFKQRRLMKEIARRRDLWPVNLGLKWMVRNGNATPQIMRLSFARQYLTGLELNRQCRFPSSHESGAESVSPFRLAAEQLYSQMLLLKGDYRVWFPKCTPWEKRLLALDVPMTESNAADWWRVIKVYLYERWDEAQAEFKQLIKHLGFDFPVKLSAKTPYESNVKSRVIDNSLKDAFIALAQPDL